MNIEINIIAYKEMNIIAYKEMNIIAYKDKDTSIPSKEVQAPDKLTYRSMQDRWFWLIMLTHLDNRYKSPMTDAHPPI